MTPSCPKCNFPNVDKFPVLHETGLSGSKHYQCWLCGKYFDSNLKQHDEDNKDKKDENPDPQNSGYYMSAFANKPIPIDAIHILFRKYRHFDLHYAVHRVSDEFDISPKIIWEEAIKYGRLSNR